MLQSKAYAVPTGCILELVGQSLGMTPHLDEPDFERIDRLALTTNGNAAPCQRWRGGRESYRLERAPIDPRRYAVDFLDYATARRYVEANHYSRSMAGAVRLCAGIFRTGATRQELCGVAVFNVPMNEHTIPRYTQCPPRAGVELGRLVLDDEVEANAESWFCARAFRLLKAALPEVCAIVSFADPLPRALADGRVITPGHVGRVYSALNAMHPGRAKARTLLFARDGRVLSERTLSKFRNGERGAQGAYRLMREMGGPSRNDGETETEYIERLLDSRILVKHRHPGNYVYVFPLGNKAERRAARRTLPASLPYPKTLDPGIVLGAAAPHTSGIGRRRLNFDAAQVGAEGGGV